MIKILFFSKYRENIGFAQLELGSGNFQRVGDVVALLKASYGDKVGFLDDQKLLIAVNQEMANICTLINESDEIAFFPPVTGG